MSVVGLVRVLVFLLQVLFPNCNAIHEDYNFLECMGANTYSNVNVTLGYILTQNSPSYSQTLHSSQQNPRWVNSTKQNQQPGFIVTPYTETQVQASILCTRKSGYDIRVRSGGHDYEGLSFRCKSHPFVLIGLINLRSITIDIENEESAWVQSGATLGELYYAIAEKSKIHGFPAGVCPSVGIGGHFSGGGFGNMVRKYGLAADNIVDAILIDVNGRVLDRETMGKDMFWAIRGGGGSSFGIIVSWKIKLVRVPKTVTVFNVAKKLKNGTQEEDNAIKVVERWQQVVDKFPQDLFVRVILQNIFNNIQVIFNSMYLGTRSELLQVIQEKFPELGLREEDCIEVTWIESVMFFAGYIDPKNTSRNVLLDRTTRYKSNFKAKSDFVKEPIPESVLQGLVESLSKEDLAFAIMEPLGGRMDEISENKLPFPHRKGNIYNLQYLVKWDVNGVKETRKHVKWIRRLYKYMKPYVSSSPRTSYLNYRDLDIGTHDESNNYSYTKAEDWGKKYFKDNFVRLAKVKAEVDPQNFFRNEQSIPLLHVL